MRARAHVCNARTLAQVSTTPTLMNLQGLGGGRERACARRVQSGVSSNTVCVRGGWCGRARAVPNAHRLSQVSTTTTTTTFIGFVQCLESSRPLLPSGAIQC